MGGPDPPARGPQFGPIETRPVRRLGVRRPPSGPGSQYPESQNPAQPNPRLRVPMPPMAQVLATQHTADSQAVGFHPNTHVPSNWTHIGHLAKPLSTGGPWNFATLTPGPEQWHVYQVVLSMGLRVVPVYTDALSRLLPSGKIWRQGHPGAPNNLYEWVRGPRGNDIDSGIANVEEAAYQARRDRTDPVRIAALREQRVQERQAQLVQRREERRQQQQAQLAQRREERRQRVLAVRAARRAEQAAGRNRQQAVRAVARLGQEAGGTEEAIGAAMQAVSNIGNPNAAPAATTAAPAIDLASAWAFLQANVPALIEAQAANTNTNTISCVICMDSMPEMVFTECGHAVSCQSCTNRLEGWGSVAGQGRRRCPICRTSGNVIRVRFG